MELEFTTSFARDLRRIRNQYLRDTVEGTIGKLEAASTITDIPGVARINPASGNYYRIRMGIMHLTQTRGGENVASPCWKNGDSQGLSK